MQYAENFHSLGQKSIPFTRLCEMMAANLQGMRGSFEMMHRNGLIWSHLLRLFSAVSVICIGLVFLFGRGAQADSDVIGSSGWDYSDKSRLSFSAPLPTAPDQKFGVGVATSSLLTVSSPSLSTWHRLGHDSVVQSYFNVSGTSPGLSLSAGGAYKLMVHQFRNTNLYLGGGAGLGLVVDDLYFSLAALGGFQFTIPSVSNLLISVDAGPAIQVIDGTANLIISAPGVIGLSLHYLL